MAEKADVVVVGSGPLGTTAARRLADRGRSVLILEEGAAISEPPGSHVRNALQFRIDPDSYLTAATAHLAYFDRSAPRDRLPGAAVTKTRGGQGTIWTNYCPRTDAPWDALSRGQWNQYYGLAEHYLGVEPDAVESSRRQQRIRARLAVHLAPSRRSISALPVAARFDADEHLRFAAPYDILAGAGEPGRRIQVADGGVERLLHDGSRVAGVAVGDATIEANAIVVAAGAIGTPHLLHRSGIRPRALGRWLSYHPILVAEVVLDEDLCAARGVPDRPPRLQIPPTAAAEWYALVLRDVSPFEPREPDVTVDPNRLLDMQFICPVDTDESKGIRFDDESRPSFEVPLSPADEARLKGAEDDADALTAVLGRYRAGCRPEWMPFGFAHMTGTTRMSAADDGTGVADYDGRVWGFENLYLATNGLIPTRMAVNPTLTGIALSARVADRMVAA